MTAPVDDGGRPLGSPVGDRVGDPVDATAGEPALRVVAGYPRPEEVAALVAVLTAVAAAGDGTSSSQRPEARRGRAPAGAFAVRYLPPTSWQAP